MTVKQITSEKQLLKVINENGPQDLFLFKHSIHCSLSEIAFSEFQQFAEAHPDVDCVYVDIFENREVSNLLEKISEIKHHSPQLIQYYGGKVHWDASHRAITQESLESKVHKEV